ncbi:MAG: hypothetical protein WA208_00520 [Thermoanaerobaculia bacterium]
MKLDLQDLSLRFLFLLAGGLSALLLAMKGYGPALPGLAIGGMLGAFAIARLESARE